NATIGHAARRTTTSVGSATASLLATSSVSTPLLVPPPLAPGQTRRARRPATRSDERSSDLLENRRIQILGMAALGEIVRLLDLHDTEGSRPGALQMRDLVAPGREREQEVVGIENPDAQRVGVGAARNVRNDVLGAHDLGHVRHFVDERVELPVPFPILLGRFELERTEAAARRVLLEDGAVLVTRDHGGERDRREPRALPDTPARVSHEGGLAERG